MFNLSPQQKVLIVSAGLTLLLIRAWVTAMLLFFSDTKIWNQISNDGIEHSEVGLALIIIGFIISRKLKSNKVYGLIGIGFGLFIDELYQVTSTLFRFSYTPGSLVDWVFLLCGYIFFVATILVINRMRKTSHAR